MQGGRLSDYWSSLFWRGWVVEPHATLPLSKELEVHQLLGEAGLLFEYQHHLPFRSCGLESDQLETQRAFADFALYASWGAIVLEVDEGQHGHQDPSCDVRRDFDMAAGSQHKLAIVRYNPGAHGAHAQEGAPRPPPAAVAQLAAVPASFPVLRQSG